MWRVDAHVRRLGLSWRLRGIPEEYEVEDDMVENSVGILRSRTYLCPQAWIMKPFLYLELELNDLSLSFV